MMDEMQIGFVAIVGLLAFIAIWIIFYFIPVGLKGTYKVVLTTDDARFGGFDRVDTNARYKTQVTPDGWIGFKCYLPNRCAIVLKRK